MLDEGPSKLYDALSLVLGLEDLVKATATADEKTKATTHAGAFLTSLTVEGWGGRAPASPSSSGATGRGSPASPRDMLGSEDRGD